MSIEKIIDYILWHKNNVIYKIIVDLDICHDTRCEQYCKWSDTNGEWSSGYH